MYSQIRDYLKAIGGADHYSIGKINGDKMKCIGVYGSNAVSQIESIGRNSSYSISSVRILIHWTKDLAESESAARSLYNRLTGIAGIDIGDIHVQYLQLSYDEPIFLGTDDNGIYEFSISAEIYYRR